MIIEEAVEKFNQLPMELQLEFGSDEFLRPLQLLEAAYSVSLSAIAIQIVVGAIQFSELSQVLEHDFSITTIQASHLAKDIKEKAFDPIIERLNFLDNDPDKAMTLEQQKNFAEKLLSNHLIPEIHHDPFIIDAINQRIFFILARDENFHSRLERALYENQELVSINSIKVNDEVVKGTVSQWLKDYISKYGSQTHDSMSQSAFLINSENAKNITAAERELLAKVLKTYINIKFFPESMPSDDGEGWEIIPIDDVPEPEVPASFVPNSAPSAISEKPVATSTQPKNIPIQATSSVDVKNSPKPSAIPNEVKKPLNIIPKATPVRKPTPLPRTPRTSAQISSQPKPLSPTPPSVPPKHPLAPQTPPSANIPQPSDELLNLKNMLLQYPPNSLEREAIEEEIKKIEKS